MIKKITYCIALVCLLLLRGYSQESTVCYNEQVTITLKGYTGKGSVQWQKSVDKMTWENIAGQNSEQLIVTATSNNYYRAMVTEGTCNPYISGESKVFIITLPDKANAGADIVQSSRTSTTLAANTPANGTGSWSVESGSGGQFDDANKPNATFSGQAGQQYMLKWTIANDCGNTEVDYVSVFFGTLSVGMSYGGGVIYTLDGTDHGIIISSTSIGNLSWGCYGTAVDASSNTNGESNTLKIAASCNDKNAAGNMCADYISNYYDNWYLPSQEEVRSLGGSSIGLDKTAKYWSSSEYNANNAWYLQYKSVLGIGSWIPVSNNKGNACSVRCFRKF